MRARDERFPIWLAFVTLALAPAPAQAGEPAAWLRPKADYTARTRMASPAGSLRGRVWSSGARERREMEVGGRTTTMILDKQTGTTWVLLPEQRMYLETRAPDRGAMPHDGLGQGDLRRTKEARESVNGVETTRYRVEGTSAGGERFAGTFWLTDDEIPVRIETQAEGQPLRMDLLDLEVRPVDPARLRLPPGWRKFEMPGGRGLP